MAGHLYFPGGSEGKASAYNTGDLGSIPGLGRSPGEGNGNPLQYSCLEKSHGQRSLVDYSPWGHKESDTTERLHFHFLSRLIKSPLTFVCGQITQSKPFSGKAIKDRGAAMVKEKPEYFYIFQKILGANVGQRSYLIVFGNLINVVRYRPYDS